MAVLSPLNLVIFGVVAIALFGKRIPPLIRSLRESLAAYAEQLAERSRQQQSEPPRIELITEQRDPSMTKYLKKFLWSPAFWATLGLVGCTTGLYFQRVAANGSGLWCLGLMFLGAAYLERKDV
jgi:Sec-independent protein translocase protein TatA